MFMPIHEKWYQELRIMKNLVSFVYDFFSKRRKLYISVQFVGQIQIGKDFLQSSFSILEDQPMDMLLGLDMLKRHQVKLQWLQLTSKLSSDIVRYTWCPGFCEDIIYRSSLMADSIWRLKTAIICCV